MTNAEIDSAISALTDQVAATEAGEASAIALIDGIAGALASMITGQQDPALPGKLQALATRLQVGRDALAAAVVAHPVPSPSAVPSAPPTPAPSAPPVPPSTPTT